MIIEGNSIPQPLPDAVKIAWQNDKLLTQDTLNRNKQNNEKSKEKWLMIEKILPNKNNINI